MKTHTQGDRVYDRSGHEGEYVGKIENGPYLVRPVLECYDEDRSYTDLGHLQEWEEIFDRAPVEVLDKEYAALKAEIEEAQEALSRIQSQVREWRNGEAEAKKRIKAHEALMFIDEALSGKITHYVGYPQYGGLPDIIEAGKAASDGDRYEKRLKLLTLGGKCNGEDVYWELNQYYDGSGSARRTIPCTSLEMAMEEVRRFFENEWEEFRSEKKDIHHFRDYVTPRAIALGCVVPDDIKASLREYDIKIATEAVANAAQNLAKADEAYAKLVEQA